MVTCTVCKGPLISRERIADRLEKLPKDAAALAAEDKTLGEFAELVELGIEEIVANLRGRCSACWTKQLLEEDEESERLVN